MVVETNVEGRTLMSWWWVPLDGIDAYLIIGLTVDTTPAWLREDDMKKLLTIEESLLIINNSKQSC